MKSTKLFDYELKLVRCNILSTEIADIFPYLQLVTYRNILSFICIGLRGAVDNTVAFQFLGCGFVSR